MRFDIVQILKALADENRIRLVMALDRGECCVCQLTELLALAPSTVSKHMSILRQARLVEGRKAGRWMFYRLAAEQAGPPVREALQWVRAHLAADAGVKADRKRIKEILSMDPEELCRKQCCK